MTEVFQASAGEAVRAIRAMGKRVVTFVGFSGAGYEDAALVERVLAASIDDLRPASDLVCAGATPEGIGGVYALAKARGFVTVGIVSSLAQADGACFADAVDRAYVIADDRWGGADEEGRLSPTSLAMVEVSDAIIAIGGGAIARDEVAAAMASGKPVRYVAADMDHSVEVRKAGEKNRPPDDFRGAMHALFVRR